MMHATTYECVWWYNRKQQKIREIYQYKKGELISEFVIFIFRLRGDGHWF